MQSVNNRTQHRSFVFSFACAGAILILSALIGVNRLQAKIAADSVVNAVTLGDTISITIDGHCLADKNGTLTATAPQGTIAAIDRKSISANALWRSVKDENADSNLRRYQNIATGNWLSVNTDNNNTLSLVKDQAKSSVFTHSWTTAYNYPASGTATGTISWTNQQTTLSLAYSAPTFALSATSSPITFEQWHYYENAKSVDFSVKWNQNLSKANLFEDKSGQHILFPYAEWKTGSPRDAANNPNNEYTAAAASFTWGYEDELAVFDIISPTLTTSSYYGCVSTLNTTTKIVKSTTTTTLTEDNLASNGVAFAFHWGYKANPNDETCSLMPSFSQALSDKRYWGDYNPRDQTSNLKNSSFPADIYNQYQETQPRNMMQYIYVASTPMSFTIKPVGAGPRNVCRSNSTGGPDAYKWYRYMDTLTICATGVGIESVSQKVPIGRQEWNTWTEYALSSHTTMADVQNNKLAVGKDGGTYTFAIDQVDFATGIALYTASLGGKPLRFIKNPNNVIDVSPTSTNTNKAAKTTYLFTYTGSGETWATATRSGNQITITVQPYTGSKRSTDITLRIRYPRPGEENNDNRAFYTYETITIEQINESGVEQYVEYKPNRGKGYATFDSTGRQQVHTYETTIYYTKGQDITLKLKERNFFGYMRWYDYNTGRDPQYYTEKDGTIRTLANFWTLFPHGIKNDAPFSSLNADPKHSKGVYFLMPSNYRNTEIKDYDQTHLPSPIIHLDEELELDIACDVSNYTDYIVEKDANNQLVSLTEPTLSYRQIFHLRPEIEEEGETEAYKAQIASELAECTPKAGKYFEEHTFVVPLGAEVNLQCDYELVRPLGAKNSDKHYWVKMDNGAFARTEAAKDYWPWTYRWDGKNGWKNMNSKYTDEFSARSDKKADYYNDVNGNYDYFRVKYDKDTTMQWAVWVVPQKNGVTKGTFKEKYITGDTLLLAHFTVTWSKNASTLTRDTALYGPSAKPLITKEEIQRNYIMLAEQNFDFDKPGTTEPMLYPYPLPASESTYGFTYPRSVLTDEKGNYKSQRRNEKAKEAFPYYGEYAIINQLGTRDWNCNWYKPTSQHTGGPAEGYCLYVDGAQEAGKVVTLTTNASLCSGQQMFCAMWLCNGTKSSSVGSNPDFSVSVEGLTKNGDWEEIERYEVGEIDNGGKSTTGLWRQINFPLVSTLDYSESRIVLYNYAATNSGNDFLVDDVWLYASRLPLEAFQASTECLTDQDGEDHTATVIRVDYTKFVNSYVKNNLYYQIYDNTNDTALKLNYYNLLGDTCGYVPLPQSADFTPDAKDTYTNLAQFLDTVSKHAKDDAKNNTHIGYVKVTENNTSRWVLYIAEIVKASLLHPKIDYEVRTAYSEKDLPSTECAMRTVLPVFERTSFLFNGETYPAKGQCANERYPLEILVKGNIMDGDQSVTLSTLARGEWLQGYDFDSIYYNAYLKGLKKPTDQAAQDIADAAYLKQYGYTRKKIKEAIADMRRDPETLINNQQTNYYVTDYHDLQPGENYWTNPENYNVIMDLCRRGLLRLALEKDYFYMRSQDTVRYWVFPTAKTARVKYKDTEYILNECTSPTFLMVFSNPSDYELDLGIHRNNTPTGQVPRIRMTQSEANTRFGIPVAAIGTNVILAWDSTQIDPNGTTDSLILRKMNDRNFSMRYTQDRIYTELADKSKYYKTGDTIYFKPINEAHVKAMQEISDKDPDKYPGEGHPGYWIPNSDQMRAGYEYTLRTQMRTRGGDLQDKKSEQGCWIGYSYITILVIPDTLIWSPVHAADDGYYHWGEDQNWRGYINGEVSKVGYSPLANSVVIIPDGLPADQYPYIEKENLYTTDVNYHSAICKKVQFRRGTHVLGQENLTYDQAFVDMAFQSTYWNTLSAPLQGMYSGDLFIPHSGTYVADPKNLEPNKQTGNYTQDFIVSNFQGTRTVTAAYALWASYYNQSVRRFYDTEGALTIPSTTAAFVESNALDEPLRPGQGFAAAGWGPSNNAEELEIRLPKTDATYSYYDKDGNPTTHKVTLDRTNAGKLAFTPDADGTMTVTLTNQTESNEFLLGNPAMAYLDVFLLLETNTDLLQQGTFRYQKNGSWQTVSANTSNYADRFVAPMQSVMLTAKTAGKELKINIPKSCFAMTTAEPAQTGSKALRRTNGHILNREIMHIVAYNDDNRAYATLAAMDFAHNEYNAEEDVIAISSGIEAGNTGTVSVSPLNIYTLAGAQPLAIDIRKEIGVVPLGFIIGDDYRTDSLTLYFGLSNTWEQECYLCDNLTGMRRRIYNDSRIRIATPANHQLRYYIQSPAKEPQTPTDNPEVINPADGEQTVSAFSTMAQSMSVVASGAIASVRIYDVVGRLIAEVHPSHSTPMLTLSAPSGVVLVQTELQSGFAAKSKVLVR